MASVFKRIRLPDRLPELRGWAMTAYVAIWLALLPVAVAMPIAGSWLRYQQGVGDQTYAFGFDRNNDWEVTRVLGPEARANGLRTGDRILAINGLPVTNAPSSEEANAFANQFDVAEGGVVRLRVTATGSPGLPIVLHRREALASLFYRGSGWTANSLKLASALVPIPLWLILLTGAILLFGRRRDPGAALFSLTFLLLIHAATWSDLALLALGLPVGLFAPVAVIGLFWSFLSFPRGRFDPRWTAWLAAAVPIATVWDSVGLPGGSILSLVVASMIVVALAARYIGEAAAERRQWRWALLGMLLGTVAILVDLLIYQPYLDAHIDDTAVGMWSWIVTPGLASLGFTLMIGGVILSVLRYRIYAAQSAVSRSLVYGTLTLSLLAIFAGREKVLELVGEEYFGQSLGALAGGLGAAFAAVAIAPLHKRISRWIEQRLRKDLIFLRERFPRQLAAAAEDESPKAIAADALERTCGILHAERGAIIGPEGVLAVRGIEEADLSEPRMAGSDNARLTISRDEALPVRLPLGGGALLLLGRKPDGSLYDKDERGALAALADPLGRALRHAARERSRDARLSGLEEQVALLAASLRPSAA